MNVYYRALRIFLWVTAGVAAFVAAVAAVVARRVLAPPRFPLWGDPADLGMPFESICFPSTIDGVRINGWFIPAAADDPGEQKRPTIILVHGWPWNRLGSADEGPVGDLLNMEQIDLLRLTHALHKQRYHVLTFDMRNHGESASCGSLSGGLHEARDLLGGLAYLKELEIVDQNQIGVVGFSMGANATLFALSQTDEIQAVVAVQPTTPAHFARRLSNYALGPLGRPTYALIKWIVSLLGEVQPFSTDPLDVAPDTGEVPILYVQSAGDPWGSLENVSDIAQATPGTVDVIVVTEGRTRDHGYKYVVDHPEIVTSFFDEKL